MGTIITGISAGIVIMRCYLMIDKVLKNSSAGHKINPPKSKKEQG